MKLIIVCPETEFSLLSGVQDEVHGLLEAYKQFLPQKADLNFPVSTINEENKLYFLTSRIKGAP